MAKRRSKYGRNIGGTDVQPGSEALLRHPQYPNLVWIEEHWVHQSETVADFDLKALIHRLRDERTEHVLKMSYHVPDQKPERNHPDRPTGEKMKEKRQAAEARQLDKKDGADKGAQELTPQSGKLRHSKRASRDHAGEVQDLPPYMIEECGLLVHNGVLVGELIDTVDEIRRDREERARSTSGDWG